MAILSDSYDQELDKVERLNMIIRSCRVKVVKLKTLGMVRISVVMPETLEHVEFLSKTFKTFKSNIVRCEFKKRGIFWRQAIKWTYHDSVELTYPPAVVVESIVKTFQEDIGVSDELTILHWKNKCRALNNQDSLISQLKITVNYLESEVKRLTSLSDELRRDASRMQQAHEKEKARLGQIIFRK